MLGNIFIIDRFINRDSRATGELIYNSGSLSSMLKVYNELDTYIEEHEPLTQEFIDNISSNQPIYDDRYAGVVILKEDKEIYRSAYFNFPYYDERISRLSVAEEDFNTIGGTLYYRKKPVAFSDGSTGKIIMGIDSDMVQKLSDNYWLAQAFWLSLFTVIILFASVGYILKNIGGSITDLGQITKRLKRGELDEPLIYNKNDEFKELAIEIEQLRISLKTSLLKQKTLEEEKKKIIGNLSHDIRTPLTAIRGYTQALDDQVAQTEDEKDEYLMIIQQKVGVIESLLNDLKALSDIDDQIASYDMVEVSIEEFIRDYIEEVTHETALNPNQIDYNLAFEQCMVQIDVIQMSRVFMNIIHNAVKYNDAESLSILIKGLVTEKLCIISIEDNGVGVSHSEKGKIFNRFYRVDKSRNSDIGGSGIGLSICRDIIEAHNGNIYAKTSQTGGLSIVIELPRFKTY